MAPKDEDELVDMMFTATHQQHPTFIRYPRARRKACPSGPAQAARNWQGGSHPELSSNAAKRHKVALFALAR